MRPRTILPVLLLAVFAYSAAARSQAPAPAATATLFEGARLIVGDGAAPIENSAFVVEGSTFTQIGAKGRVALPRGGTRVDVTGKTVIPALVDVHSHPGYRKRLTNQLENYTRDNFIDTLNRYAYYGVGAVLGLGTDRGDLPFQLGRETTHPGALFRTAGGGFAMPNAGPGAPMRGADHGVTTEAEARRIVDELAAKGPALVKVWVDDRNGTVAKLPPVLYRAIIDQAHKHRLRVVAHVFDLEDAKDLLRSGIDGFAHPVRDLDVDDELIALFNQRPKVFVTWAFWGERRGVFGARPAWINEPLLREGFSSEEVKQLADSFTSASAATLARQHEHWELLARGLKRLNAAGVPFGLGTDTGGISGGQFFGWSAHMEMESMVRAGMTPAQVIVAATRNSAEIMGLLDQLGTIAAGKSADFVVLDANPLDDITHTRKISRVYLKGAPIDRRALRAKWDAADSP